MSGAAPGGAGALALHAIDPGFGCTTRTPHGMLSVNWTSAWSVDGLVLFLPGS